MWLERRQAVTWRIEQEDGKAEAMAPVRMTVAVVEEAEEAKRVGQNFDELGQEYRKVLYTS
jgi:hypothetical protein